MFYLMFRIRKDESKIGQQGFDKLGSTYYLFSISKCINLQGFACTVLLS